MYGRYGMDQLNRFLLYVAAALVLLGLFVQAHWLNVLTILILIVVFSRAVSRSFANRQRENMKYLEMKSRVFKGGGFKKPTGRKAQAGGDGKRVLICPYCKGKLKVPVGAGKIKVNCPHCHRQFEETV